MPQSVRKLYCRHISYAGIIQIRSRVRTVYPAHLSRVYAAPLIQFEFIINKICRAVNKKGRAK